MRRLIITAAIALTGAAALTGCATTAGPAASASSTAKPTATAAASTRTPSATETAVADPKAVAPSTPAAAAPNVPAAAPSVSALAQHIYDQCSTDAVANGVRLTLTANPSGYTETDGHYQLIYPFMFLDGHDDPYAVYNCALTDDTVTSKYVGGGLSDAH